MFVHRFAVDCIPSIYMTLNGKGHLTCGALHVYNLVHFCYNWAVVVF